MSQDSLSRRGFLRVATGTGVGAGAVAAGGAATAQSERPDWGGWLDGVEGGFEDARGQSEVTVEVGAQGNGGTFAFSPAGLWIDPGTTVTFEWVSNTHNVVVENQPEGAGWEGTAGAPSETYDTGHTYEHTFEETGIRTYFCNPHLGLDMKGAIAVGDDVPTGGSGNGGGGTPPDIETPTVVGGTESSLLVVIFGGLSIAFVVVMTAATLHLTYLDYRQDHRAESSPGGEDGGGNGDDG